MGTTEDLILFSIKSVWLRRMPPEGFLKFFLDICKMLWNDEKEYERLTSLKAHQIIIFLLDQVNSVEFIHIICS